MPTFRHADADLFYTLDGAGPAVILLTGFAVGGGVWESQVPVLKEHFQVVCLDNRGAGRTRARRRPGPCASWRWMSSR